MLKKYTTPDGRVLVLDPLVRDHSLVTGRGKKNAKPSRTVKDDSLIIRFLHLEYGFNMDDIALLLEIPTDFVYNVYLMQKRYLPEGALQKLCDKLGLSPIVLLLYAKNWANGDEESSNMPCALHVVAPDGSISNEVQWFSYGWLQQHFKSLQDVILFKVQDNKLGALKLVRDDLVLVHTAPEAKQFQDNAIYLIKGFDNRLYLRQAAILQNPGQSNFVQKFIVPNEPASYFDANQLAPDSVCGQVAWKWTEV